MKKLRIHVLSLWVIVAIVSKVSQRYVSFDPTVVSLKAEVIFIGTTPADQLVIGENSSAEVDININGVNSISALHTAIAAAVRTWATAAGFTVNANNVLQATFSAS